MAPQTSGATSSGVTPPPATRALALACIILLAIAVLGVSVVCGVTWANGGRWFAVNSPSMGEVAPVGSLVVSAPADFSTLEAGDIIVFHPPTAPNEVYTHRIAEVGSAGILTRGDINGSVDPWTVQEEDLIGTVSLIAPGVGWLVRALPYLAIGWGFVYVLTWRFSSARWRAPLRLTGATLVVSIVAFIMRPFVGIMMLYTNLTDSPASATVVSTGMLPIRVTAEGGSHTTLVSGEVGTVTFPPLQDERTYQIFANLDLPFWGWVVAVLICAIPLLWTLIVGLPANPSERTKPGTLA